MFETLSCFGVTIERKKPGTGPCTGWIKRLLREPFG